MSDMNKVVTVWTGWPGGPGFTTMYFDGASTPPLAALQTFWTAVKALIPTGITLQVQNTGVGINLGTGKPDGNWSGTAQTAIACSAPAQYAGPVGGMFEWRTGQFENGREMRGRSFVVPFSSSNYDGAGTITDSLVTTMTAAATTLIAATPKLGVWSRTSHGFSSATSAKLLDKACVMRSRRAR